MADINIGSISAKMAIDPSGVTQGAGQAINAVETLQKRTENAMGGFSGATEAGTGRARDALGRFVTSAKDGTSAAGSAFEDLSNKVAAETKKVSDSISNMKIEQAFANVGTVLAGFSATVTAATVTIGKFGAEFEQAMRYVNTSAHMSEDGFKALEDRVISLSERLGLTKGPQEMAKALYEIYGAGLEGEKAMGVLEVSTKLATIANTGVAESSKVVTEALRAFNLTAGQADMVGDQLWRTVEKGRLHFDQLAAVLGPVYTKASQFGVSMEEVNAAMAVLAREMPTSEAATALERLITQLAAPTERSTKGLQGMGVELGRGALQTKGLLGVLQQLTGAMDGSDQKMRKLLASSEGLSGAYILLNNGGKEFKEMLEGVSNAQGAMADGTRETMKGPIAQWQALRVEMETTAIKIRGLLLPVFGEFLGVAKSVVKAFDSLSDTQKTFAVDAALVSAAVAGISGGFLLLAPAIAAVPAAFEAIASSSLVAGLSAIATPLALATAAIGGFAYAWKEELGGVQTQLTAFVGVIKDQFSGGWAVAIQQAQGVWTEFAGLLGEGLGAVQSTWLETWPAIRDNLLKVSAEMAPVFVFFLKSMKEDLPGAIEFLGASFKTGFKIVADVVGAAWVVVSGVLQALSTAVKAAADIVSNVISGNWRKAWAQANQIVSDELGIVIDTVKGFLTQILQAFADLAGGMFTAGELTMKAFNDGMRGRLDDVRATIEEVKQIAAGPTGLQTAGFSILGGVLGSGTSKQGEGAGAGLSSSFESDGPTNTRGPARTDHNSIINVDDLNKKKVSDEDAVRARLVKAADDLVGTPLTQVKNSLGELGSASNKCADTIRAIGDRAGLKFGVNTAGTAADAAGLKRIGQGTGPDFADSFPGRMIPASQVKPGDLALFKNTSGGYGNDVVTHVGIVIDPAGGMMVDASSQQGKVAKRKIQDAFPASQLYGFVRPQAIEEAAGKKQGGTGVENFAASSKAYKEFIDQQKKAQDLLTQFADKSESVWDRERDKIVEAYDKAYQGAVKAQLPEQALINLRNELGQRITAVNDQEAAQEAKTISELTLMRVAAEGKAGTVAELQIQAKYKLELANLDKLAVKYRENSQVLAEIDQTRQALNRGSAKQVERSNLTTGGQALNIQADKAQQDYSLSGVDPTALSAKFAEFSGRIKDMASKVQAFFRAPSEETRADYEIAIKDLDAFQQKAIAMEQRKLEDISFNRAMGKITTAEAIQQEGQILNASVQSDQQKRQMILTQAAAYKNELQQRLTLQGTYNLKEIEALRNKLLEEKLLTTEQQRDLAALTQAQTELRLQQQQQWVATVQAGEQAFSGFLQSVLSGQQSFGTAFTGLWKNISGIVISEIVKMIIKATALEKILSSIFSFFGGPISGFFGGILGIGGGVVSAASDIAGGVKSAAVNPFAGLGIPGFHIGGMVTSSAVAGIPLQTFHSGGPVGSELRSDEVLAKLQTGEYVMSRSQVAQARNGNGSGRPNVVTQHFHITAHLSDRVDIQTLQNDLGRLSERQMQGMA